MNDGVDFGEWRRDARGRWLETGELPTEWAQPGVGLVEIASMDPGHLANVAGWLAREAPRNVERTWLPWVHAFLAEAERRQLETPAGVLRGIVNRATLGGGPPAAATSKIVEALEQARELRHKARLLSEEAERLESRALAAAASARGRTP